jgi:hypothetical protein
MENEECRGTQKCYRRMNDEKLGELLPCWRDLGYGRLLAHPDLHVASVSNMVGLACFEGKYEACESYNGSVSV